MLLWVLDGEVESEQTQVAGQHRRAGRVHVEPAGPFVYWFDQHSRAAVGRSPMANLDRGWSFARPPGSEETASTTSPSGVKRMASRFQGDERSGGHAVGSTPAASQSPSPPAPTDQSGNC